MPGTPSGRGCDACRKVKKKCDADQPSCSRCRRLNLRCIGGGLRRFKFIQTDTLSVRKQQKRTEIAEIGKPATSLSNETTWLVSSFVSGLAVKDPRFDLACYGPFLLDIPKRLGLHPALDASASALISMYPTVYKREPSSLALTRYGRALQVMRASLEMHDGTQIVEVLCAIYFLLICQTWMAKPDDHVISHGRAIAEVLNIVAGKISTRDLGAGFGHQVLTSMSMVVIIESVWDPTIRLHPRYRVDLMVKHGFAESLHATPTYGPVADGLPRKSLSIGTLARLTDLVRTPRTNMPEIFEVYKSAQIDCEVIVARQAALSASLVRGGNEAAIFACTKMIALCQTGRSLLLSIAIACNVILSALPPWDDALVQERVRMCDDVQSLEREVSPTRPLGASHMPLCLVATYLAVGEGHQRTVLGQLLLDYESDFPTACWLKLATQAVKTYDAACQKMLQDHMFGACSSTGSSPSAELVDPSFCGVQ